MPIISKSVLSLRSRINLKYKKLSPRNQQGKLVQWLKMYGHDLSTVQLNLGQWPLTYLKSESMTSHLTTVLVNDLQPSLSVTYLKPGSITHTQPTWWLMTMSQASPLTKVRLMTSNQTEAWVNDLQSTWSLGQWPQTYLKSWSMTSNLSKVLVNDLSYLSKIWINDL